MRRPGDRDDGEAAIFQVVEAIFVAVLVASALIFFALVQKPTPSPQGAGLDLARVAGDGLGILVGDASLTPTQFETDVADLLPSSSVEERSDIRTHLDGALPAGLRYQLRASVQTTTNTTTVIVHGPTVSDACDWTRIGCPEPRNAQGAVRYILDEDAIGGAGSDPEVVLVELVVWNAF